MLSQWSTEYCAIAGVCKLIKNTWRKWITTTTTIIMNTKLINENAKMKRWFIGAQYTRHTHTAHINWIYIALLFCLLCLRIFASFELRFFLLIEINMAKWDHWMEIMDKWVLMATFRFMTLFLYATVPFKIYLLLSRARFFVAFFPSTLLLCAAIYLIFRCKYLKFIAHRLAMKLNWFQFLFVIFCFLYLFFADHAVTSVVERNVPVLWWEKSRRFFLKL